jgi:hypothetical protein
VERRPRLKRYLKTGKPAINWEDADARRRELAQLVADAELALQELPAETDKPAAAAARGLLQQVARQDAEINAQGVRIRQGVAKDRVISTVDPEMRHGHKSSAGKWNGYKKHLSVEPKTELITAVEVTAANAGDGAVALALLQQQAEVGLAPGEVVADMAHAGGELRAQALRQGEGTLLLTKAATPSQDYFDKSDFVIDLAAGRVSCPADQVAPIRFRRAMAQRQSSAPRPVPVAPWPASVCGTHSPGGRSASTPTRTSCKRLASGERNLTFRSSSSSDRRWSGSRRTGTATEAAGPATLASPRFAYRRSGAPPASTSTD